MTTVLFACVHNAGRSQIAAALFNRFANPSRAHAISAGTKPGPSVHPMVVEVMRDRGVELSGAQPRKLTDEVAHQAQWLITLGCGEDCPFVPGAKVEDWPVPDPKGKDRQAVEEIADELERRVRDFIQRNGF